MLLIRKIIRKIASLFRRKLGHIVIDTFLYLCLYKFFPRNPGILESHLFPGSQNKKSLCVFASYSRSGSVAEYVFQYMSAIEQAGFDIIFVTTSSIVKPEDLERLRSVCVQVIIRKNVGYDFGSWKAGLIYSGVDRKKYDRLLLTNDSCYAPIYPLSEALEGAKGDLYGITDSFEIDYHLMSYFVLYSSPVFHSPLFDRLWLDLRMIPTSFKSLVVLLYEIGMSQTYLRHGYTLLAYCPIKDLLRTISVTGGKNLKVNAVHRYWRELIEQMRCPILKVDLFWRYLNPQNDDSWIEVIRKTDYDEELINLHQRSLRQ
jgi:lipopolysaccharide biosynthesis protein